MSCSVGADGAGIGAGVIASASSAAPDRDAHAGLLDRDLGDPLSWTMRTISRIRSA